MLPATRTVRLWSGPWRQIIRWWRFFSNDFMCNISMSNNNKSIQNNLLRGPRRSTIAHVRRKVPIGYNGAPQIRPPKSIHSRGPIPKPHHLPHPWTRLTCDAKHPDPIRRFSTMHWTDRPTDARTHRPTDRPRESLITIGRCATRATRPNNKNNINNNSNNKHIWHRLLAQCHSRKPSLTRPRAPKMRFLYGPHVNL